MLLFCFLACRVQFYVLGWFEFWGWKLIFCYFSCLTVKAKNNEINHDDDDDNDDEDDDFLNNIYIFYIEDAWIGIKWGRGVGVGWGGVRIGLL